jgi:hypothetical protein
MSWPPRIGELLPQAGEAIGVREKLADYALNTEHKVGGPKAKSFDQILGITIEHAERLEATIRAAILATPIGSVRANPVRGFNCVVEIPVAGMKDKRDRIVNVRTVWELTDEHAVPRLVSAFPKP